MKKFVAGIATATVVVSLLASTAFAAVSTAPGQDKLLCFSGTTDGITYGGTCTLKGNGAKGPAVLSNTSSDPDGDYSGVYIQSSTLNGQLLSNVAQLGYTYSGTVTPTPGDLSLNVPLNLTGGTTTDAYAFIDAYYCPGTAGKVDVIHDSNCGIWVNGVEYANWAALVTAYPTATVSSDLAFIVAERTPSEPAATWTVSGVTLGKPGK